MSDEGVREGTGKQAGAETSVEKAAERALEGAAAARGERPRRSDATRAAILNAARDRFAADGYERATIRAIASQAGIDPSMVMRYYGNKEGLFAAASEFDLHLPELDVFPRGEVGVRLAHHLLDRWEEDETLNALVRVGVTNPAGAERMHAVFREQVRPVVESVCPDPAEAGRRAALAVSQILGLAISRYVLKMPYATELTRAEVVAWLGPTLQRYLTAPGPETPVEPAQLPDTTRELEPESVTGRDAPAAPVPE
ncbi:TetR family transcriptional regulator [Streptomyces sp. HNM0574]|uniref:TetR/AcrR family transcriptional regulator n=1 Tax=Streptomyces sp. HNM0574 TaxID=2714954 RepID=UPI00146E748F|nr:TetR family transcriptional regulator [Streptomyces sp. HNM0574]NLU70256.1 TetR/AcrR family transcriptional regulator [Streptomyces sp. HNM0574]